GDGHGPVDRVEARQRDGDHQRQPEQDVQHHGGAQALARHHHRGVVALDALGGEELVAEPGAAQRPGGDHVRDRGGGQVDAEQPGQAGVEAARRQHGLGQQAVAEQRQALERQARDQPGGIHPAEQVEILARADKFGHDQVLDDQDQGEQDDAAPQWLDQEGEPGAPAAPLSPEVAAGLLAGLAGLVAGLLAGLLAGLGEAVTGLPAGSRRVSPHIHRITRSAGQERGHTSNKGYPAVEPAYPPAYFRGGVVVADAASTARTMWTLFEPVHAVTYFTADSRSAYEQG